MIYKLLNYRLLLALSLFFLSFSAQAQSAPEPGKSLFLNNCAACHAKDMKTAATGPALGNMEESWAEYDREDLYKWIRNSQALIAEGHPRATELWNQYKPTVMNAFPNLTDDDIESIIAYVNYQKNPPQQVGVAAVAQTDEKSDSNWMYYGLFALLAVLAVVLARVISNLQVLANLKDDPNASTSRKTLIEILTSRGVISFLVFALIVLGAYFTVNNAVNLGRQQGYSPDQPIKFSHTTHAGMNGIDCQYCHDGARRSKHAVIPAANTCMNCHSAIKKGSTYGTAELTKIYASIGYDPNTSKYIDGYEDMSNDEIKKIFTKWIGDNYVEDQELTSLDNEGSRFVEEQWDQIVTSLTNEQKSDFRGPIEWTRIHNLPDHVYFNHSQHVTVGKIDCAQCHGKVEEMDVLEQYAPLSMGWCINCHRQTDVQFSDNPYYEAYQDYHDQIKSGDRNSVKVEDIGGIECQKCHY